MSEFKRTKTGYGLTLQASEWQLDLRYVSRQDGQTSVALIVTMVDGDVRTRSGMYPTINAKIKAAVSDFMEELIEDWGSMLQDEIMTAFEDDIDGIFQS